MTRTVSIHDAKRQLGELIDSAARGDDIVIAKNDQAQARLVPVATPVRARAPRRLGRYRGKLWVSDDFDAPLPEAFWLGSDA